jgi:hypothetical protein
MGMKWVHLLIDEKGADKLIEALEHSTKEHPKGEKAPGRLADHLKQVRLATKAVNTVDWKRVSASQLVVPWTKGGKLIAQLDKALRLNLGVKEVN